jgi:hypothetical protein
MYLVSLMERHIQYVAKSIGACKKKSLYNEPKPYFLSKNYCEVIS